ncbi:MAG: hypothetical protein HY985_15530 [Magnetospirillum sp.]|nr:hypothetical protein [Magnetospirillum sp.]
MTNPTFPVAPLAGRTLKWAADGSETLINSECDPDLVAAQACQSAAAAVEAAVSTKTAAFASGAKAAEAAGSAAQAAAAATLATTQAAEAACSVTAVTTVVDEAVTAAANAAQSAAQAEGAALSAGAYAATAAGAASQVTAAASQAADAAISAGNAADAAAASATQAAGSATSATGAASTATTAAAVAGAAADSAVQAASAAESSAGAAQGSATQASGLATIAINAATEAAGSATQAAAAESAVAASAGIFANEASAAAVQALGSAQNAADWATKMDGPVSGGEHSAKWHAASIVGLAGRVRVSDADTTGGFLGAKVVPGPLLSASVDNPGANEQVRIGVDEPGLTAFAQEVVGTMIVGAGGTYDGGAGTIALPSDQAILDRLATLETNLAVTVLRDRIDSGGSVLKMVNGWADEFEDQSGIDSAASINETYDPNGDYYGTATGAANLTPAMLSFGGTGMEYNVMSSWSAVAAALLNGDLSTNEGFALYGASSGSAYVQIDAGSPVGLASVGLHHLGGADIGAWKVYHSDDGSGWTDTGATFTTGSPGWGDTTAAAAAGSHRYWRLVAQFDGVESGGFNEMRATLSASASDMTLVSNAVLAAQTVPAEARLVVLHQPMTAVTLGTDLTAEVSRDGGITWTAAALTHQGAFDATTAILTGTADLSAQPAGTAMKWRLRTLNDKEQRIHGVSMHWR